MVLLIIGTDRTFLASFATTLPEITVSIISSIQGNSTIALGNALGSVLVNIAFILGISS
ncbi:MAG: hypothetical protein ABDH25_00220, partial [Dictyoglomaceae bacterium]